VKFLLPGRRTALIVCQAMSMAMTVVLPAPVASFSARRISSGLASRFAAARWSRMRWPCRECGATSVSQIAVSTASTWQKNGRTPLNGCWRQCCSRRAVSGVT
jgi:phage terminase large subunit GpA-like protein